jgi:predicted dithiol-disulfide oxidoreductase (DUF899 family)
MDEHDVVPHEAWLEARRRLLAEEKEFTRQRDRLSQKRRELPWERVAREYVFTGPNGRVSLAELFGPHSQLVVYHFMFDPSWDESRPHCSFWADSFDRIGIHLQQRDVQFVAVSHAALEKLQAFQARMGWSFPWLSSFGSDFNYDFDVAFRPEDRAAGTASYNYVAGDPGMPEREGISVFYRDAAGSIFHTYSAYARGIDMVNSAYQFIDLTPKGRDEAGHDNPQFWVRHRDRYDSA